MESFEDIFAYGGHANSLGRSREVLDEVKSDPTRMTELFDCIYSEDAWVRMRAMDTFEKAVRDNPELAKPYTNTLVYELTKSDQPSIQWHLAQLYTEVELSLSQQAKAISWLKGRIAVTAVDWIVAVNVMKTLLYFYELGFVGKAELKALYEIQSQHQSKTVCKKAQQFLEALDTNKK